MKKEMLINVLQPEECRIAILEDGVLEELYVERTSHESYVGNIYKGRIVNIEPSIQAAFVDFGVGRNGFLHVSDVEPTYYRHLEPRRGGERGERGDRGDRGDRGERRGNGRRDRDRDRDRDRPQPAARHEVIEEDLLEPIEEAGPFEESIDLGPADEPAREGPEDSGAEPERAVEGAGKDFAAGVLLEVAAEQSRPAPQDPDPPVEEASNPDEAAPPLVALPDTIAEEDAGKPRRRSRSTTPRRRRSSSEPKPEEPAAEVDAAPEAKEEGKNAGGEAPRKPPLMGSAERRTDKNEGPEGPHEISPVPQGLGSDPDPDLFFPSSPRRPAPPPAPAPREAPEAPREAAPPAPVAREPVEAAPVSPPMPAPERLPPGRRPRPSSRRSIEEDLEEDLRAAEIGDEAPLPEAVEEAREEGGFEPEFDDLPPRGRPNGGDRGERGGSPGPREGGRGDRGGDRGGRPREGGRGERGGRRNSRMGGAPSGGGGRPGAGRPKPLIQDIFKRGQEVIVQVIKEGIGTKGPTLSTYISIAGRYLVLMPCLNRTGVSRKINDDEQRRRLREMFNELKPPRGLGFIMRTAAIDKNKRELQRDLVYLSRLWQVVAKRIKKMKAPAEIYQESDMITRTIRDTFTSDIDTIWVDEPTAYEHAKEFLEVVMPRFANRIKLFEGNEPLFHKCGIEDEIARIQLRKVPLPMGGSIVIEQTEALVAIDVNSGNFRAERHDAEETAYQMNLQAAKEIARQLRLRDMGGVIVNDFIDMRDEKHRRGVEKALRDAMKRDRARTKILKISAFGIIEMTRQRIRPSLKRSVYQDCPYCHGAAQVKTVESMSIEVMRLLQLAAHREAIVRVDTTVTNEVADYLLNKKRREISKLEETGDIAVTIRGRHGAPPELLEFLCLDNNGNEVKLLPPEPVMSRPRR